MTPNQIQFYADHGFDIRDLEDEPMTPELVEWANQEIMSEIGIEAFLEKASEYGI